jgi:hypothetical protein
MGGVEYADLNRFDWTPPDRRAQQADRWVGLVGHVRRSFDVMLWSYP